MGSLEDTRDGSMVVRTKSRFLRWIFGYLVLDDTEDDDDDDETTQKKLLILVTKDVEDMSMPRRGWCLCCVDLGIAERYCKVMESHRS